MRQELQGAIDLAASLDPAELPRLLGELREIEAVALARLTTPKAEVRKDELLDITETSRRMGVGKDYLYRNSRRFPFVRRVGRKLLFSSMGLDAYLRKSR